jgi:hypothetical protein
MFPATMDPCILAETPLTVSPSSLNDTVTLPTHDSDPSLSATCTAATHLPHNPAAALPSDILLEGLPDNLDILPAVHAARLNDPPTANAQADIGSNINATAGKSLLENYNPLAKPFNLLGADASVNGMLCPGFGYFPLPFLQGTVERIKMYYCPQLSETLISPQHICTLSDNLFTGFDICCRNLDQTSIRFFSQSGLCYADAPLTRSNNLFSFTQLSFQPKAHHLSPLLSTELWHQCLGHPGMHQLQHLQACTTGLPSGLHKAVHPLHTCKVCNDARARRSPMGPTVSVNHPLTATISVPSTLPNCHPLILTALLWKMLIFAIVAQLVNSFGL